MIDNIPPNRAISVGELTNQARLLIENNFQTVRVEGEISNFSQPTSGHWYFTLKDEKAQIRCAMFAGQNRKIRKPISNGEKIVVSGRLTLYEARGDFQIIVEQIEAAGEGALQAAFDALKNRLEAEGLFSDDRKTAIPEIPKHLVIISSPSGAALQDVLNVIERRLPSLRTTIVPVSVQGEQSKKDILEALERSIEIKPDVILLTRGGGSLEDLWTFNLEEIARSVAQCSVPIVVAVGHQTDFTIAEFAADLRAPTPSAAAELITPDKLDLFERITNLMDRLVRSWDYDMRLRQEKVKRYQAELVDPKQALRERMQHLDDVEQRLVLLIKQNLQVQKSKISNSERTLHSNRPDKLISNYSQRLTAAMTALSTSSKNQIVRKKEQWRSTVRTLEAVSPLNTIGRGYSVLSISEGKWLTSVKGTTKGQNITAHLKDGSLDLEIIETSSDNKLPKISNEQTS